MGGEQENPPAEGPGSGGEEVRTHQRVCPKCSSLSTTDGDFCPRCGAPFIKRSPLARARGASKRTKLVVAAAVALLVLAGAGTGVALKIQHDNDVEAEQQAEEKAERERQAKEERVAEDEREAERAREIEENLQRDLRNTAETSLEKAIKKDAQGKANEGLLEGPILAASCQQVGRGKWKWRNHQVRVPGGEREQRRWHTERLQL